MKRLMRALFGKQHEYVSREVEEQRRAEERRQLEAVRHLYEQVSQQVDMIDRRRSPREHT